MRSFSNANPRDMQQAAKLAQQARMEGRNAAFAGGGSDMLGLIKERIATPDVLVHLKGIQGANKVETKGGATVIGGQISLSDLSHNQVILKRYAVLAEAAGSVATPQIRNAGTLAGNVCQRPWCWYFRNGFPCFKAGGSQCFSFNGENQFHAIFGGGPSFIVHPSDTAVALMALDAKFRIVGPSGQRTLSAADFFTLPKQNAAKENALAYDEVLASVELPAAAAGQRSSYHKVLDRDAWTHAVVSTAVVLDMNGDTCRSARIVLGGVAPIPWRVPEAEKVLTGQRVTPELAARAAETALAGAQPLAKNAYKIPLTKEIVQRTVSAVARA
ncbi:MAG: xanthine dehydrogenase family protein subunit M [Bryobacterales bacterium]|nr:xanthine dehydrogenase family protein subunit M [Bryobacterales bacterium]